tara:strand:- start:104 stop:811 length:708 start_codon:yes stop_codon:yes gene_type:complete
MSEHRNVIYRIENDEGDIVNIGETSDRVRTRMDSKFKETKFIQYAISNNTYLRIMTPQSRRVSHKEAEAVYLNNFQAKHRGLPTLNSRRESPRISPTEWGSGLRSLARSVNSTEIGISNTNRGRLKTPNQKWIESREGLQPNDFENYCKDSEVVYEQSGVLYFIGPKYSAVFYKKRLTRKWKYRYSVFHWDFFMNENSKIGVYDSGNKRVTDWTASGVGELLFSKITELALRTNW